MQVKVFKDEDLLCAYLCLSPASLFAIIYNTLVLLQVSVFLID